MADNKLKMNEDKTEIILIGMQNRIAKVTGLDSLMVLNSHIPFVENVKNLDSHWTLFRMIFRSRDDKRVYLKTLTMT